MSGVDVSLFLGDVPTVTGPYNPADTLITIQGEGVGSRVVQATVQSLFQSEGAATQGNIFLYNGASLGNVAALRANTVLSPIVMVLGYSTNSDGGEGIFVLNPSDTTSADNGGTIIVDAVGHRYYRQYSSYFLNVRWFGVTGNGTTDDTAAIKAAVAAVPSQGGAVFFPAGTYLITATIFLPSNCHVFGVGPASHIVTGVNFIVNTISAQGGYYSFFINTNAPTNFNPTSIVNTNITIEGLYLDYGGFARSVNGQAHGGKHAIYMLGVQTVIVKNCLLSAGLSDSNGHYWAEDGTAFEGCYDTLVDGCSAYNFGNCAYDHWCQPQKARVVNCYAESPLSNQMVNFNPEGSGAVSNNGYVADGLILANNEFVCTGSPLPIVMQIEPLGSATFVRNVVVSGNIFKNVFLSMRGATRSVTVSGNVFTAIIGGVCAIDSYPLNGGTPDSITVTGNTLTDISTAAAQSGAVRLFATNSIFSGNTLSGTVHYSALATSTYAVIVGENSLAIGTSGSYIIGSAWTSVPPYTPAQTFASQSFSPVLQLGGASVGVTYGAQSGKYSVIQNVCFFQLQITLTSKGSSTGTLTIQPGSMPNFAGPTPVFADLVYNSVSVTSTLIATMPGPGSNGIAIQTQSGAYMTDANITNSTVIIISGSYLTS